VRHGQIAEQRGALPGNRPISGRGSNLVNARRRAMDDTVRFDAGRSSSAHATIHLRKLP